MIRAELVPVHEVGRIWPFVKDHLKRGCARAPEGTYRWRLGEIEQMCRSGNGYLIIMYRHSPFSVEMASVWQFVPDERGLAFRCQVLGGRNMRAWLDQARAFITDKAKEGEADRLTASGRSGWSRLFPHARQIGADMEVDI